MAAAPRKDPSETVRVAFQGEPGAYSEAAALQAFPDAETVPCHSLNDVFRELASGRVDDAVAAIENSQAGSIHRTYDLLRQHDLFIVGEVIVPIDHCLMALPGQGLRDLERVRSHPSALEQCEAFLVDRGYEMVAEHDTAGSARHVAEDQLAGEGAIASQRAAGLYGLEVLAENVQTVKHNRTRFVVLGRAPLQRDDLAEAAQAKTSIVFATDHRPGALYRALGFLAERDVNLLKLESRPSRGRPWEYVFHVELEGHREDANVREALAELGQVTTVLKVLGSYPRADEALV